MLAAGGREVSRAASLCTQLPMGSRVLRSIDPDQAWTVTDFLLRQIELDLRLLFWDGKGEAPKRIPAPGDAERDARAAKQEQQDIDMVSAAIPGIG